MTTRKRRYKKARAGEWEQPIMYPGSYFLQCCDCRLVHKFQFTVVFDAEGKPRVKIRAWRAERKTAEARRDLRKKYSKPCKACDGTGKTA